MDANNSEVLTVGKYVRRRIKIKGEMAEVSTKVWGLECPLCAKLGKTGVVPTPATHVWQANLGDLEKVIKEGAGHYAELIEDRNGRPRTKLLCAEHGAMLRNAGIRTYRFHETLVRSSERRLADKQRTAANSIASILGGAQVEAIQKVGAKTDKRKAKSEAPQIAEALAQPEEAVAEPVPAPRKRTVKAKRVPTEKGKGRKVEAYSRSASKRAAREDQE